MPLFRSTLNEDEREEFRRWVLVEGSQARALAARFRLSQSDAATMMQRMIGGANA